jgi:hypothetical protein
MLTLYSHLDKNKMQMLLYIEVRRLLCELIFHLFTQNPIDRFFRVCNFNLRIDRRFPKELVFITLIRNHGAACRRRAGRRSWGQATPTAAARGAGADVVWGFKNGRLLVLRHADVLFEKARRSGASDVKSVF